MRKMLGVIVLFIVTLPAAALEGWSFVQTGNGAVYAVGLSLRCHRRRINIFHCA
jgi:hypothetical protein